MGVVLIKHCHMLPFLEISKCNCHPHLFVELLNAINALLVKIERTLSCIIRIYSDIEISN